MCIREGAIFNKTGESVECQKWKISPEFRMNLVVKKQRHHANP